MTLITTDTLVSTGVVSFIAGLCTGSYLALIATKELRRRCAEEEAAHIEARQRYEAAVAANLEELHSTLDEYEKAEADERLQPSNNKGAQPCDDTPTQTTV